MKRNTRDKDGRHILFESDSIRITKVLCPHPEAYQFMLWEKKDAEWVYKETISDWNAH